MLTRFFTALLLGVLVAVAPGCALLDRITQGDRDVERVVKYGTLKTIDQASSITADGVVLVVSDVRTAMETNPKVTVGFLVTEANKYIPWEGLDPADRFLLNEVLVGVEEYLLEQVGAGVLDGEARMTADNLLRWIEEAAYFASMVSSDPVAR